ncbi:hypothetical protein V2J09_023197 [Rumex salicifolius]
MYTSSNPSGANLVTVEMEASIDEESKMRREAPYSACEVENALKEMHPLKASGPDGIVKGKVVETVLNALNSGELDLDINKTCITLIPKKSKPLEMKDFRPISLSNFLYVDDCILFAKADEAQVETLKSILAYFEMASG